MDEAAACRSRGNEGRARVCARRAVGAALALRWAAGPQASAYQLLQRAAADSGLPPELRQAAQRLTRRVNQAHRLPHDEDPLDDARSLLAWLRPQEPGDDPLSGG
jgi:hypothetical protein